MTPIYNISVDDLSIDASEARNAATPYAAAYQTARPYNHICIDDFLPVEILEKVEADLRSLPETESSFDRDQERLKTAYSPDRLPFYSKSLFHALNSRPFIFFLEQLTGIKGLIPDPYYMGAGIHRVANGGHLDIHADFNLHTQMQIERRLNVLIYLNRDWREEWGGSFEVWNKTMTAKEANFVPIFNRMVCFSTASDTFHGNPMPVNQPDGVPRLSIALYYYTATWGPHRKSHTTLFKPRPDTVDKPDGYVMRRERLSDLVPPILYRRIIGPLSRLGF
jgi:Rps23 Pro-64 3,4-dihydroxylase Tpa1-like proline 4-hydroxylase